MSWSDKTFKEIKREKWLLEHRLDILRQALSSYYYQDDLPIDDAIHAISLINQCNRELTAIKFAKLAKLRG